jgi:hypothetical protein
LIGGVDFYSVVAGGRSERYPYEKKTPRTAAQTQLCRAPAKILLTLSEQI